MKNENKLFAQVHITKGSRSGKMAQIDSINTSTLQNDYCSKMRENSASICKSCYSATYSKMRLSLENKLVYNSQLLSENVLIDYQVPRINSFYFRFNSFGELINEIHFINLVKICELNPQTSFSLWTKKISLVQRLLDLQVIKKPANLILIASSPALNCQVKLPRHFDKVFSVYTRKGASQKAIFVNCGGAKCIDCLTCYTKSDVTFINELRK